MELPALEGVVVLNINSWSAGCTMWREGGGAGLAASRCGRGAGLGGAGCIQGVEEGV